MRRRKIAARLPLRPRGSRSLGRQPKKARQAPRTWLWTMCTAPARSPDPRIGSAAVLGEAGPILLTQLKADPFFQCPGADVAQVVVEVGKLRHKRYEFDPRS